MSFIDKFIKTQFERHRKHAGKDDGDEEKPRTKQFNTTIAPELFEGIRTLAAMLGVPRWVVVEHALQNGFYHLIMACRDLKKEKIIREHLVKHHLLSTEFDPDNIDILRIDEVVYPTKLVRYIRELMRTIGVYEDAVEWISRGGDARLVATTMVQLRKRSFLLGNYVTTWLQHLDNIEDASTLESNSALDEGQQGENKPGSESD
jgi:hypothetical protein